jgi:hypothetical protein
LFGDDGRIEILTALERRRRRRSGEYRHGGIGAANDGDGGSPTRPEGDTVPGFVRSW